MSNKQQARIQLLTGSTYDWTQGHLKDVILLKGEAGINSSTGEIRYGTGDRTWSECVGREYVSKEYVSTEYVSKEYANTEYVSKGYVDEAIKNESALIKSLFKFNDGVNDPIAESKLITKFYKSGSTDETLTLNNSWKTYGNVYGTANILNNSATMYMTISWVYLRQLFADEKVRSISFDIILTAEDKIFQLSNSSSLPDGISYTASSETVNNQSYFVYQIKMTREYCSKLTNNITLRYTFYKDDEGTVIGGERSSCFYVDNLVCLTDDGEIDVKEPWNASNTYLYSYTVTKPGFYIISSVSGKADINIYKSSGSVVDADVPNTSQLILFVPENRGGQRCLCFYGSGLLSFGSEPFTWDWGDIYTIKSSAGFRLWSLT